jgi:hypothetical protein
MKKDRKKPAKKTRSSKPKANPSASYHFGGLKKVKLASIVVHGTIAIMGPLPT